VQLEQEMISEFLVLGKFLLSLIAIF